MRVLKILSLICMVLITVAFASSALRTAFSVQAVTDNERHTEVNVKKNQSAWAEKFLLPTDIPEEGDPFFEFMHSEEIAQADAVAENVVSTDAVIDTDNVSYDCRTCFDNTAFLGNSSFIAFRDYGLAKNVYPVVGLDVRTVFTKHVDGSDVPVIDELDGKDFDRVILMFGVNECGWPNKDYFIEKYALVIDAVRERIPDAEIYIHACLPVSEETSEENISGCNNEAIAEINERLKQLAIDKGAYYIDVPQCLLETNGALIADAATDGVHLNGRYTAVWMDYLEAVFS